MNENRKIYIQKALDSFASGGFLLVHDADREDEGDVFLLSEHATPQKVNQMLHLCRGVFCVALEHSLFNDLVITLMSKSNNSAFGTNFGVNIDAIDVKTNNGTGVTAAERAQTLQKTTKTGAKPSDFVFPGHVATLQAQNPHHRFGHTEAAVELARIVGAKPSVAISEVLNAEGGKASWGMLQEISKQKEIPLLEIEEIKALVLGK